MFWLACVATAQAPTLSDRVDALEAIVQKLESTVHEQRLTDRVHAGCTMWYV